MAAALAAASIAGAGVAVVAAAGADHAAYAAVAGVGGARVAVGAADHAARGADQGAAWGLAAVEAFTLAGGGDTIAAIQKYDIYDKVSYISTAGGAFLEYLEGKVLPAVEILEKRAAG